MYNMLHLSLEQALENELIAKNFLKHIKLPKLKNKEMCVLCIEEQKKLQSELKNSYERFAHWSTTSIIYRYTSG
ncbi:MAG TPA: hypothetical protein VIK78_21660 [Ruminiclostridium sp.]